MQNNVKDVVVIGGGIVGSAIIHALSAFQLRLALIEKQPDICEGTSKANSGIIHTGFDATPGTIEADCLRRSGKLWPGLIEKLKIPFLPCGAVMVAATEEEEEIIRRKYMPNAKVMEVDVRWIEREELLAANPAVSPQARGGLLIEGEGICDPFWATRAFAELAVLNGAELMLGSGVAAIESDGDHFVLTLENGERVISRYVVNAAGLWSDDISAMIGDRSFTISPRKGQFVLTEDSVDISQIVLPVPTRTSKGILVSPVVFGGFLIGPTAEDMKDKWDRSTDDAGMESVIAGASKLVESVRSCSTIRQFAGLRAVCSTGDFVIRSSELNSRFVHAAGIRSTGVSASPGIAQTVAEVLSAAGLLLTPNPAARTELPDLFEAGEEGAEQGEIVCLCRSVTRGELKRALCRPAAPRTIDGVKRRTGAMLGECQGNNCIPGIIDCMQQYAPGFDSFAPVKSLQHSYIANKGGNRP